MSEIAVFTAFDIYCECGDRDSFDPPVRVVLESDHLSAVEALCAELRLSSEIQKQDGDLIAALRAEVERLTQEADIHSQCATTALGEVRAIRARLAELEEAANIALAYVVTPVSIDERELERKLRAALGEGKP